jgi:uncharacterized protein (DUF1800 family)
MAQLSGRQRFAHLYRRAGFGATEAELTAAMALHRDEDVAFEQAVARLLDFEAVDEVEDRFTPIPVSGEEGESDEAGEQEYDIEGLAHWWLERMLRTRRPFLEKMVLFWHGHFATSAYKDEVGRTRMLIQNELFREHALGSFEELLNALSRDPAMIAWLDLDENRRGSPNENYARELMELFTLGIGTAANPNYTEADVKEAARAFTGYAIGEDGTFEFRSSRYDPGVKTVLGRSCETGDEVNAILVRHRKDGRNVCAHFLAAKLFSFLAYPATPADAIVTPFAEAFVRSDFSVRALAEAILLSPEFSSDTAYRALVKSPIELAIGMLRALGARRVPIDVVFGNLWLQGQIPFAPPSVGGWPSGPLWINSSTVLSRNSIAVGILYSVGERGDAGAGGRPVTRLLHGLPSAPARVDRLLELLVDGDAPPATRAALIKFAEDRDDDVALRGLFNLVLALPVYQLN